jgi:hypothetical protein
MDTLPASLLAAAAISLAVMSAGRARTKTTVLLTPEEIDQAVKRPVDYEAPPIAAGDQRTSPAGLGHGLSTQILRGLC